MQKWGEKPYQISWVTPQQCYGECPDYLNDLNAMRQAEEVLTDKQWNRYTQETEELLERDTLESQRGNRERHFMHASAAQRAEAFLRTLNLWTP